MVQPKRRVPGWAAVSAIAGPLLAIPISLATNDLHDKFKEEYGGGYTMELPIRMLAWEYTPVIVACVGIIAIWLWSQGAPGPGPAIVPYALAKPDRAAAEAEPSVMSDGIKWVYAGQNYMSGVQMRPECPTHHVELKGHSRDGGLVPLGAASAIPAAPYCVEGHEVPFQRSANYEQARQIAKVLLEADLRRRA